MGTFTYNIYISYIYIIYIYIMYIYIIYYIYIIILYIYIIYISSASFLHPRNSGWKPVAVVVGQQKNEDPWAGFYACLAGDWRGRTSTLVSSQKYPEIGSKISAIDQQVYSLQIGMKIIGLSGSNFPIIQFYDPWLSMT